MAKVMNETEYQAARDLAINLGHQHGGAAASWYFDGNTEHETYVRVLKGIEDGDPKIMDTLPSAPLSGEDADSLTPRGLLSLLGWNDETVSAIQQDELCSAYEEAFWRAAETAIVHACQYQLA